MSTEITTKSRNEGIVNADYFNPKSFEHIQRVAKALASSTIVPKEFQGNVANCIVALEMSRRMNIEPFMVMQNLHIIHGRPSWKSEFIISALRSHPDFVKIRFEQDEQKGGRCRVVANTSDGHILHGTWVSIEMAKTEGWFDKSGSKWKTMPDQMLLYRAASFFSRVHCPEILNGMRPADEVVDIESYKIESSEVQAINDEITTSSLKFTTEDITDSMGDEPIKLTDDNPVDVINNNFVDVIDDKEEDF